VSDYRLNDRGSIPCRSKRIFTQASVSRPAHLASCTMGTRGPFPGGKTRPGRDADHSSTSRDQEWVGAIPPLPPDSAMACSGTSSRFTQTSLYIFFCEFVPVALNASYLRQILLLSFWLCLYLPSGQVSRLNVYYLSTFLISQVYYTPRPYHPPFCTVSSIPFFLSHRSKYSPQHLVPKHSQYSAINME
jgi:hypothetical protein